MQVACLRTACLPWCSGLTPWSIRLFCESEVGDSHPHYASFSKVYLSSSHQCSGMVICKTLLFWRERDGSNLSTEPSDSECQFFCPFPSNALNSWREPCTGTLQWLAKHPRWPMCVVQYQKPTQINQGVACSRNPWPNIKSSRAKKRQQCSLSQMLFLSAVWGYFETIPSSRSHSQPILFKIISLGI